MSDPKQLFDFFGSPVNVGDIVAFNPPKYNGLVTAKIIRVTDHNITLSYLTYTNEEVIVFREPTKVVKRP